MHYRRLGRTGLNVSVLSLGTGGPNRLGQSRYVSRRQIQQLVYRAIDLGINFFDTSGAYENVETILGEALRGVPRSNYFLSSKIFPLHGDRFLGPAEIRRRVDRSLQRLRVDELDVFHLHRITPGMYETTRNHVLPELQKMRDEGRFRFIGITESSTRDPQHEVVNRALGDDLFDTIMVGYHPGDAWAAEQAFPLARARDVGVIAMAAARNLVYRGTAQRLGVVGRTLIGLIASPPGRGQLQARLQAAFFELVRHQPHLNASLGRLAGEPAAQLPQLQFPEAAYTYAVSHPAVASVLTGTTNPDHLQRNVAAALAPPLHAEEIDRLRSIIGGR